MSLLAMTMIILTVCARTGFPPGGPVDKTPPKIIATNPEPNTVNVPLDTEVEFLFSEKIERKSVEEALFVTPYPGGEPKLRWKGRQLRIKFPERLRANRTYVVTLGTDAKDLRNNRMKDSFSLAFSTGSQLDEGRIPGAVYGPGSGEGVLIWAYDLLENPEPDPSRHAADYVTQCGSAGDFSLSYVAPGPYRVFAVLDKDRNKTYDAEYDALGVAPGDVRLTPEESLFDQCNFRLSVRDTSAPRVDSALAPDQNHVDIRFSESMRSSPLDSVTNYTITDSTSGTLLAVRDAYIDPSRGSYAHLVTAIQEPEAVYELKIQQAFDPTGILLDSSATTVGFKGSATPDTLGPQVVSISPADSMHNVPATTAIEIIFSEAMDTLSVAKSFALLDSSGHGVRGTEAWPSAAQFTFHPNQALQGRMRYTVSLQPDSVFDVLHNTLQDTLFRKTFWTLNTDTLAAIRGTFTDDDSTASGPVFLRAVQVQPGGVTYDTKLEQPGNYVFKDVLPGTYLIDAFRDQDRNNGYSFGQSTPFVAAERFIFYSDSILVRPKWPNEGNDITLPNWKTVPNENN